SRPVGDPEFRSRWLCASCFTPQRRFPTRRPPGTLDDVTGTAATRPRRSPRPTGHRTRGTPPGQPQVGRPPTAQGPRRAGPQLSPPAGRPAGASLLAPVPKPGLRQLVLSLTRRGHSSLRGVTELLDDLVDYPWSVGTAHNIGPQAVATARRV